VHLEHGDVAGQVVADHGGLVALPGHDRGDGDAGGAVNDVVISEDQPIRGVDDEPGALGGLIEVLQVGAHVDDAWFYLVVDDAVVHRRGGGDDGRGRSGRYVPDEQGRADAGGGGEGGHRRVDQQPPDTQPPLIVRLIVVRLTGRRFRAVVIIHPHRLCPDTTLGTKHSPLATSPNHGYR